MNIFKNENYLKVLYRILMSENPEQSLNENIDTITKLCPSIKEMIDFDKKEWEDTLKSISKSSRSFELRTALLFHNVGVSDKPVDMDDRADVSTIMAKKDLRKLGFERLERKRICFLIRNQYNPINNYMLEDDFALSYKLCNLQLSDVLSKNEKLTKEQENYFKQTEELFKTYDYASTSKKR